MNVIKLNADKKLFVTKKSELVQGDDYELLRVYIEKNINGIDIKNCTVTLRVTDGNNGGVITLINPGEYKEHYKYEIVIPSELTLNEGNLSISIEMLYSAKTIKSINSVVIHVCECQNVDNYFTPQQKNTINSLISRVNELEEYTSTLKDGEVLLVKETGGE